MGDVAIRVRGLLQQNATEHELKIVPGKVARDQVHHFVSYRTNLEVSQMVHNSGMCRPKEPITVDDLLGKPKPEMTDDEFAESFAAAWKYRAKQLENPTKE